MVFLGIGAVLFAILVVGFIGMVTNLAPMPSPSGGYGTDGAVYVSPPPMATMWLAVVLMDVVALLAFGIISAFHNQQ